MQFAQSPRRLWLGCRIPPALGLLREQGPWIRASLGVHGHSHESKGEKAGVVECEDGQRWSDLVGGCIVHLTKEKTGSVPGPSGGRGCPSGLPISILGSKSQLFISVDKANDD